MKELLTKNEIACKDYYTAAAIQKLLLDEDYIVMLSKEDEFWIVNYIWEDCADRNLVIFIDRQSYYAWENEKSNDECGE